MWGSLLPGVCVSAHAVCPISHTGRWSRAMLPTHPDRKERMSHRRFTLALAVICAVTVAALACAAQATAHTICARKAGPTAWRTAPDIVRYVPPGGVVHIPRHSEVDAMLPNGRPLRQCWFHDLFYRPHFAYRFGTTAVYEPDNSDLYSTSRAHGFIVAIWLPIEQ